VLSQPVELETILSVACQRMKYAIEELTQQVSPKRPDLGRFWASPSMYLAMAGCTQRN